MDEIAVNDKNRRLAGAMIVVASICVAFTMGHHPSGGQGMDRPVVVVHTMMIGLLIVLFSGFLQFCRARGLERLNVSFGLVAYGVSLGAHVGAATINGFVVGALAARGEAVSQEIFLFCWEMNQALARLGVVTTGAAMVSWSAEFFRERAPANRSLGALAAFAGVSPVVWLAGVSPAMNVHSAFFIYTLHALWMLLVGVQMFRRRI